MKKFSLSLVFSAMILLSGFSQSGPGILIQADAPSQTTVSENSPTRFKVKNTLTEIKSMVVNTPMGTFTELIIPDYSYTEEVGLPKLPVKRQLIDVPWGAEVHVNVISFKVKEYHMDSLGMYPLIPAQPPVVKSSGADQPFQYQAEAYQQNSYTPALSAHAEVVGIMRANRIGRLDIYPVAYNPATHILKIYEEIELEVIFDHPDLLQTRQEKQRVASPYFEAVNHTLLNQLSATDAPQDTVMDHPIKYVIVSNVMFQATLQPFIAWKKKKGFDVIEAYTNNPAVGSTTTSIKAYLQSLYNAGTSASPPPSFVLFVGDVAQLPTFSGTTGTHPTDLYYCEYTNDYLPEIYYGRFSATTVAQLQSQIDKTLEYEQYTMPDPSFLNDCVMIGGVDATYGPTHANGQINYGTSTYFNLAHGLTSHTYLYPASGNSDAQIREDVNNGVCYANYTAHGSPSGWYDPSFTTTDVPNMTNAHMYPLMVGNACLTNKFDDAECFGEALLRANLKGAVGYIGASNSTYWDEDFYWGCGAKTVVLNPTYSASALGAYDRTFHDHGESYNQWFMTQGQMIYAGNLAVSQGAPGSLSYYWEIYHLMGDPSLMIYFSQPQVFSVTYSSPLPLSATSFTVTTEPYAYCAVSMGGVLHGAAQADATGVCVISITPFAAPGTADVVVTKQNRQPFQGTLVVANPNAPLCAFQNCVINDILGNNNGLADYGENIQLTVGISNVGLQPANAVTATLSSADAYITITDNNATYGNIAAGSSVSVTNGFAFTTANNIPDGHLIPFVLTMTSGANTWTGNFSITAHAPSLSYLTYNVTDPSGNNNSKPDPGETFNLIISLKNNGSSQANNVNGQLSTTSSYIIINTNNQNFGNMASGATVQSGFSITASPSTPQGTLASFTITATGSNGITTTGTFSVVIGQIPVLIVNWDGNSTAATPIENAILANNVSCQVVTTLPANLSLYSSIFVCLGIYNANHSLTTTEGSALQAYLNAGGKLYMEGGDTWFYDTQTAVHPLFKITGQGDGSGDLGTIAGQTGTFTAGMSFTYSGDNSWIDRIAPTSGSTAFTILSNTSPAYGTAVAYDGTTYKTIGASHEFAGLTNGTFPSTRNELMKKYLEFLGVISTTLTPDFSANQTTINAGSSITFTDLTLGAPTSWSWSFPGGTPSTSSLQNPTITYSTPGTYNVTLTATNAYTSNSVTKTAYIVVNPVVPITASLGSYNGCSGTISIPVNVANMTGVSAISMTINLNSSILNYLNYSNLHSLLNNGSLLINQSGNVLGISWTSITPITVASGTLFNLNFQAPVVGSSSLQFDLVTQGNCQFNGFSGNVLPAAFNNGSVIITGLSVPVAVTIGQYPGGSICSGTSVTFTAAGTNGGASPVYQWRKNGTIVGTNSPVYTSSSLVNGDNITCIYTSSIAQCTTNNPALSNTIVMSVAQSLPVSVSIQANPSGNICQGTPVNITATAVNPGTNPVYQWQKNGVVVGANSPVYSTSELNNADQVQCQVTSSLGCVTGNPAGSNIITASVSQPLAQELTITASPSGIICQGAAVTFSALPVNGGSNPLIQWYKAGTIVATGLSYTTSSLSTGDQISAVMTTSGTCATNNPATSNVIVANVMPVVPVSVNINAMPAGTVCQGSPVSFTASGLNGGSNPVYRWLVNGMEAGTNFPEFTSTSLVNGDIVICQLISSLEQCTQNNPANSNPIIASIVPAPQVNLGADTTLPLGDSILLDAGAGQYFYSWSTGAITQTLMVNTSGLYSVQVFTSDGCQSTDTINVKIGWDFFSGNVTYKNAVQTPMSGVTVSMMNGNVPVMSTTTDNQGHYLFTGVPFGNFTLKVTCNKTWGGANSTDALLIMKHFVGITLLTGLNRTAADVDNSTTINSADALMVQKRSVMMINQFPSGDWAFERPAIVLDGQTQVIQNIKGLTYGDVNGSYIPPARMDAVIPLQYEGVLENAGKGEISLPVTLKSPEKSGAVSLSLRIPDELTVLDVQSAEMLEQSVVWNVADKNLMISWYTLSPETEVRFQIHLASTTSIPEFAFQSALGEVANADGQVIPDVSISLPKILGNNSVNTTISDLLSAILLPNPVQHTATLHFNLSQAREVMISFFNLEGQKIREDVKVNGEPGDNGYTLNVNNLSEGVYFLRLESGSQQHFLKLIRTK